MIARSTEVRRTRPVVVGTEPWGVEAREATWRERFLSRLLVRRLDQQLAEGRSPESSPLLSLRAQRLARPATRLALARSLGRLLREAAAPRVRRQVPLADASTMRAVENDLVELVDHLVAPAPVSARGVALVHELLVDGAGPLYRNSPQALSAVLRNASRALEPDVDWPAAA